MTQRIVFARPILGTGSALTLALVIAGTIPSAFALSLGAEQVTSSLGQPLRMTLPLLGSTAESLETRCYRVVAPSRVDGLTVVTQARIELQSNTNPPQLIVRSSRAIDDPIVRITIEAGCDAPIRREYTILLDPPPVQAPEPRVATPEPPRVATPATSRVAAAAPPPPPPLAAERAPAPPEVTDIAAAKKAAVAAERAASRRAARAAAAASSAKSPATEKSRSRNRDARAAATAKQIQQDKLEVQGGSPVGLTSLAEIASLSALAVPRLRIASDLVFIEQPTNQSGAAPVDELQAAIAKDRRARLFASPIESDLAPRLEADLVVAQRRLAELQSQLAAAGMVAKTDGSAAIPNNPPVAVAPTVMPDSGWAWQKWAWIPGLLLVVGLIAFLLRQRRKQTTTEFAAATSASGVYAADDEISVVRSVATANEGGYQPKVPTFGDALPLPVAAADIAGVDAATQTQSRASRRSTETYPIIATRAEREASDRLNNPLFQLRDTESHVDVTELSQVTDEAQVYADLGRNDQAIELLRDHIDSQTGELTSPAPWLMIFELYRRTNNRQGYDELAPQFRKHFNGRVPDWDNYGHELALDDGLEAFPHLVTRIERDWGTAGARKFLEELLYDNRGGSRLGFSLAAYRDILLLLQVHEALSAEPDFLAAATDWESRGANDSDGTPKWDLSLEMIEPPKTGELESFFNRPPPDKF